MKNNPAKKPVTSNSSRVIKLLGVTGFFFVTMIYIIAMSYGNKNLSRDDIKIVVDAGHGGYDPGKVGHGGILEKDINLSIAGYLADELVSKGFRVKLTRNTDSSLDSDGDKNKKVSDMRNRIKIVNEYGADIMISIHQNSYTTSDINGAQVFYADGSSGGKKLAEIMQECLKKEVDGENTRKVKASKDYYILNKSKCTGVIVECGFLSNPAEAQKLNDSEYQQKIAKALTKAVLEYYKGK